MLYNHARNVTWSGAYWRKSNRVCVTRSYKTVNTAGKCGWFFDLLKRLPYLPVYNAHFFFVKLTFKFAMRIIHGSHCLVTFSLAYCKQEPKFGCKWFLFNSKINNQWKVYNFNPWINILHGVFKRNSWLKTLLDQNINMATKLTATKRQSYSVSEKLRSP